MYFRGKAKVGWKDEDAYNDFEKAVELDEAKEFHAIINVEKRMVAKRLGKVERETKQKFYKDAWAKIKENRRKGNFTKSYNPHALKH